ncbi:MAG: ATP-binding protein [Anaerolineaceae bacterium]|nr:ATP-binding protein [Anaerolineaceae bacterium]
MIPRTIETVIYPRLSTLHKAIILLGARQVGKTTLLMKLQKRLVDEGKKVRFLNCDLEEERQAINTTSRTMLDRLVTGIDAIFIDEIQRLNSPGLTLKILVDLYPQLMILVTGSSSYELRNQLNDALTGRYLDYILNPLSFSEVLESTDSGKDPALAYPTANVLLPDVLRHGFYPEIYLEANPVTKQLLLAKIVESYLFKDILAFHRIRYSQAIVDLTRALAYQIGSEVNENELSRRLKIDRKTILSYIDILEKSYVVKRLYPFSRNPRREIGKQSKIYFIDLGIRNALIGDFNDLDVRTDQGAIWENFLIVERWKLFANLGKSIQSRFWRAYSGAEVDYIEESSRDDLKAYELKLNSDRSKSGKSFFNEYGKEVITINKVNYLDFITKV